MHIAVKIGLWWFCLFTPLFSADLNTTLVNGDAKLYMTIYQKISSESNKSDEISLQKTLLEKLIKLSKTSSFKERNITIVSDKNSYLNLFNTYIQITKQKRKLEDTIQTNSNKITTLSNQIKEQNSTTLTEELFYALYSKEQQYAQRDLLKLKHYSNSIKEKLVEVSGKITFDVKMVQNRQNKIDKELSHIDILIQQLRIKKERSTLLEQSDKIQIEQKKLLSLEKERQSLYEKELEILFSQFTIALQKKEDRAFSIQKKMLSILKTKIINAKALENDLATLLTKMEKQALGTLSAIKGKGVEELHTQVENLWQIVNRPIFTINKTKVSIFKLIVSLLIFIIGFIIGSFYKRQIKKLSLKSRTLTSSTRTLLSNLGYYVIFIITFFIVLKILGINLGSIALVAGALSVGIGFGLQNVISNFVSGIILMIERSIKIGDYIQIDDELRGYVNDIRMRSITIVTNENIDIIIPNQKLIENNVINWTMNDNIRRFSIPFGVAYGTDAHRVINLVTEAVLQSKYREDIVENKKHQTSVIMTEMGNSSVNFELFVWVKGDDLHKPKQTASTFLILIYDVLNKNGIEIPFPQQDLHIRSIDVPIPN